jgi:SAM-dependent methyltransferase
MNFQHWYQKTEQTFLKSSLLNAINQLDALNDIDNITQLGGIALSNSILQQFGKIKPVIVSDTKHDNANIIALNSYLPLQNKSVDFLFVFHRFEISQDPHVLMREIHRVVKDDGYVLLVSLNDAPVLGIIKRMFFSFSNAVDIKRKVSIKQADDWFSVLGFSKRKQLFLFGKKIWDNIFNGHLKAMNHYLLHFGDVYCCLYQKQVVPLTFDLPKVKRSLEIKPILVETRNYEQ